jgi:hypothetical protein
MSVYLPTLVLFIDMFIGAGLVWLGAWLASRRQR